MGFLRVLGKFLGSTIFITFLVLAILLTELTSFTSYNNFKSITSDILKEQVFSQLGQQQNELRRLLILQCAQTDKVGIPVMDGQQVVLNCDDVRSAGEDQLENLIITALVDSIYYKNFTCSFVECVKSGNPQNLLIVVTNEGNLFYKSSLMYMWAGSIVGLALLVVSSETWIGRLKGVGFNLIFTALPFIVLVYIQPLLISLLPEGAVSLKVAEDLFTSLKNKFIIVLVIGVILIIAGYGLGFYSRSRKK